MITLEILEIVKSQLFMTEKGLVSIETLACKAIAEVKVMQKLIKELEEAMKPKTCSSCKHFTFDEEFNDGYGQCFYNIHKPNSKSSSYHCGDEFYCAEYEPKDTQCGL